MSEDQHKIHKKEFYELNVWKKARSLRNDSLRLISTFPSHEKYGLADQVRRASRSIPACIAEGHGRFTYKDQIHFCIIARGSATELLNHFIDAFDQHYLNKETLATLHDRIKELLRMINAYIAYLKKQ